MSTHLAGVETFIVVLGALFAGLSIANTPSGLYIAEGVQYVGCFPHGRSEDEEVLEIKVADCTLAHSGSCLIPATCIDSCQNISANFVYVGLKFPGECFCDSILRGVSQTDSVDGINCDGRCFGDPQLACGHTDNMLVYQFSGIIPQMTTSIKTSTMNSSGYKTEATDDETTTTSTNKRPQLQNNTALIAGAAAGGSVVLIVAGAVLGVCLWRKRAGRRRDDKPSSSLALQDVSHHTSHPPSDSYSNPTAPPNPSNIEALYAKPDKKRKQKMSSPDDPSYQDVIATGAQHQYATVSDNQPPNLMVRKDPNPYDSIQNDPQYAVVNKRPKHRPNVDVNPIYMGGSGEGGDSPNQENTDMLGMVDNVIYE